MIKKVLFLFMILLIFTLLVSNYVHACSIERSTIFLKCDIKDSLFQQDTTCLKSDCSINVSKNQYGELYLDIQDLRIGSRINEKYGIKFYGFYNREDTSSYQQLLHYLDSICVENINDIKPIFTREVQNWMLTDKGAFLGGNLIFEPYSKDRESELIESKNKYSNCYYEDSKKIGDWFVITETSRDYCYLTDGGGGMCPSTTTSYTKFLVFLLSNPNRTTFPYLTWYLILFGTIIGFLAYLFKRKELKLFFNPNKFNIIFTLVLGILTFLLFILFMGIEQIIILIIGYYILASVVKYIYTRIKNKQHSY